MPSPPNLSKQDPEPAPKREELPAEPGTEPVGEPDTDRDVETDDPPSERRDIERE